MNSLRTIQRLAAGLPTVGRFMRAPLPFLQATRASHGDVAKLTMLRHPWLILSHPEDIERVLIGHAGDLVRDEFSHVLKRALGQGLLTSEGELWKRQRRLAATAFTPKRIRGYATAMARVTANGLDRLAGVAAGQRTINLHEEMSHLTMEVVADVLFGASVGPAEADTVRDTMHVYNDFFAQSPEAILRLPPWVPTPRNRAMNAATRAIDALVAQIIEARRSGAQESDDLLSALLGAIDEDGTRMDDAQLRDEILTLFLAGHETTALALTHAIYLLAKHPEIEARALREIRHVLGDRALSEDDVPKLVYVDRIVKESMRLFPPAWITGREAARPFELALHSGERLAIEEKTQIVMSQWIVHRDPRWFPNPEVFDPDRFDPEYAKQRPRYAYFPFGGGPRVCIGNHFATMEANLMLAMTLQRYHFELVPFEELRFAPSVTLRPKGEGVHVTVSERLPTRRTDAPTRLPIDSLA
ncbi:MAG: cytochrome P450 [Polyangiaceae bacterium]